MKRFLKVTGYLLLVIVLIVAGLLIYVKTVLPSAGKAPDLKVEITPARIERGEYLANNVMVCMDCHSTRDWTKFTGPLKPGTLGNGGEEFGEKHGFPGTFYSKNITPYGIGSWSDGEVFHAITAGISKDGKALFPVMPHPNYGTLDKEDIYSVIAYLRTLPPVTKDIPESKANFPVNFIINTIPKEPVFSARPNKTDVVAYGKYLFTAASCGECHTRRDKGTPIEGMELAGGMEFPLPGGGTVRSANITPDRETGIGKWSEEDFLSRFKAYSDSSFVPGAVQPGQFNTMMPWTAYGKMEDNDLKAIYTYLRTVKSIKNEVEKFTP